MLTRRQALQAILAAPALRLTPIALAPMTYISPASGAPTITFPPLRPGETIIVTVRNQDGSGWTKTATGKKETPC